MYRLGSIRRPVGFLGRGPRPIQAHPEKPGLASTTSETVQLLFGSALKSGTFDGPSRFSTGKGFLPATPDFEFSENEVDLNEI